jgi:hypothetical protein
MPGIFDPETTHVDVLPGVWSPVQWELNESEHVLELEDQARASLMWAVDSPETILRLLLNECKIERTYKPPKGYSPQIQGDWNDSLVTFMFKRAFELVKVEREREYLCVEYKVQDLGYWVVEIMPDRVEIRRG